MSRKWERMVNKNQKNANKIRKKQGQTTIQETMKVKESEQIYKGRSWMLPSVLVLLAVLYFISDPYGEAANNKYYWLLGLSYAGLGALIFLINRPVIKISKTFLTVRRFSGIKMLEPKDIEEITVNKGHAAIRLKVKNRRYIYTKFQHRFNMNELNAGLKEYAIQHKIKLQNELV